MANSPWGTIQYSRVIAPGCREVSTAGHGGLMLTEKFALNHLSRSARDRALVYEEGRYARTLRRFYCYEEDCDYCIAAIEVLDLCGDKMFEHCPADSQYSTQEGRRAGLIKSLSLYNAEYLLEIGIVPTADEYAEYLRWRKRDQQVARQ